MSKDIVQRLLENVPCFDAEGNRRKKPCGYDGGMCPECRKKQDAADLIEALEAEVRELREVWHKQIEVASMYFNECETLKAEVAALKAEAKEMRGSSDYSIDLQRLIETVCRGRTELPEARTTARFHRDMVAEYIAKSAAAEDKASRMRAALNGLLTAVCYADPPTMKFGVEAGLCHEARVPTEFVIIARKALEEQ